MNFLNNKLHGLALCFAIAVPAAYLGKLFPIIGAPVFAIILGLLMAGVQFVLAGLLWIILLGWIIHLWSILDAALWKPQA